MKVKDNMKYTTNLWFKKNCKFNIYWKNKKINFIRNFDYFSFMAVLKFHSKMADIINTHINFEKIPLQKILVLLFLARKLIKFNILDHFKI